MRLQVTRARFSLEPSEVNELQPLVPLLVKSVDAGDSSPQLAQALSRVFPNASYFGLWALINDVALLTCSDMLTSGPLVFQVASHVKPPIVDCNEIPGGAGEMVPPAGLGSMLCVPLRVLGGVISTGGQTGEREEGRPFAVLVVAVDSDAAVDGHRSRLAALAQLLAQQLAPAPARLGGAPKFAAQVVGSRCAQHASAPRIEPRVAAALAQIFIPDGATAPTSELAEAAREPQPPPASLSPPQLLMLANASGSSGSSAGPVAWAGSLRPALPPHPPCTSAEIQALLNEILDVGNRANALPQHDLEEAQHHAPMQHKNGNALGPSGGALAPAGGTLGGGSQPGMIVLPGPHDVKGDITSLAPEDRWFEQHWLWLTFKDPELERRFNWWHNRQCVKLDSGFCWFAFTILVVLLTVEPFSLAKYHPNAFPLAFLIVPGVYILHRWDTDWYIKRRHAVLMVQTTYYVVYCVVFVTPVFLNVKPPATLRRPLWLLRITGVEGMLMHLVFQIPFEKFFWLGVLHLGIISSSQRTICHCLYPELPDARCSMLLTALQFLLGFVLTMLIASYLEKWRRKGFLKHVRAERPDPKALQRRGKAAKKAMQQALKDAMREQELAHG